MNSSFPKAERLLELTRVSIQLQQVGLYEDSLEILEKILRLDSEYAAAYVVRGLSLQAVNAVNDAEVSFREALKLEPTNDQAIKSLGLLLVSSNKIEDGTRYLSSYHKRHPEDLVTLKSLVSAYTKLGKEDYILSVFEQSWQATSDIELGIQYTRFLMNQRNNEAALDIITQVVEKSTTPRTLAEQSLVLVVLQKYEQAIEILEQALELNPNFDRALRGLSFCYTKLGQFEEAIESANSALAIDEKHYRNWQAKGDALLAVGKFEQALITADTAINLIDLETDPEAEPVLGVLYIQKFNAHLGLHKTDEALREIEEARKILPNESRFYTYPAQLLLGLGNIDSAEKILDLAEETGNVDYFPLELRIKILLETRRFKKAWKWLDPIMDQGFNNLLVALAYQYYNKHENDIARNIFEHLVDMYPDTPELASPLAFLLTGYGEYKKAESLLLMSLKNKELTDEALVKCNLGYIYMATNKLDQAKAYFQEVLATAEASQSAIARIGFWRNQGSEFCCISFPALDLPLTLVAKANLIAIDLQDRNIKEAENLIQKIIDQYPETSLTYQLLGSIQYAKNKLPAATKNWKKALKLTTDDAERKMIEGWLDDLAEEAS